MNRPVFIATAVCAALLVGVVALRFTDEPGVEEAAPGKRSWATDPGVAQHRTERGGIGRPAPEQGGAAAAKRGGRVPDDRLLSNRPVTNPDSSADTARVAGARGGGTASGLRGREGDPGLGHRRAPEITGDDANFRAAAERLAASDPAPPASDGDAAEEETIDDGAREPPATPVVDDSMTYNSGDYRFSLDSPFQIPNSDDTGTVALWLQPEWSPENDEDAAMIELGDGLFRIYKNVNVLRFEVMSDSPEHSAGVSIAAWQPGEWHSISATWEDQHVTFYVDGQPVAAPIRGNFAIQGNTPVTIGALHADAQPVAPGTVSDVSLRNRALPASEIARLHDRSAVTKRP